MKNFINNQRLAQLAGVDFNSEEIKPGPIVYSRTHTITSQFSKLSTFPDCILITSFSDAECTTAMSRRLPPNVKRWYSNNVAAHHPRIIPIPIGLRTSSEGEVTLRKTMDRGRLSQRNLVYMNFWRRLRRTPNPRKGIYEMFGGKSWVTTEGGFEHVAMDHFYEQMISHPYILSPPGAGPDCHRHWESILLGSIPIVLKSPAMKILYGLPCLQVNHWGEVTEERLLAELPELQKLFHSPDMEIIWFDYWKQRILEE